MSDTITPLPATFGIATKDLFAIETLAKTAPHELTDHDLRVLATFDGDDFATAAARRREEARYLKQFEEPAPVQAPSAPAASTLSYAGVAWDDWDSVKAWVHKNRAHGTPLWLWENACSAMVTAHQKANKRLLLLERDLAELQVRVDVTAANLTANATKGVSGAVWGGVWEANHTYKSGEIVTHGGNLWICTCAATAVSPGSDPVSWKLILRRGKSHGD
jgi:hypothetical protein